MIEQDYAWLQRAVWEQQARQSLIRDNTQLDRKFKYIMYNLGRLYGNS